MTFLWAALLILVLFLAFVVCLRVGWALGRRHLAAAGKEAHEGLGAVEAAIFGMMGLLLAFTFTGAAGRFDHRRDLIVEETNAIGTAWLRLDLLQEGPRNDVRELFRQYLDQRLEIFRNVSDRVETAAERERAAALQAKIWQRLMIEVKNDRSLPLAQTVLPPVNEVFDIGEARLRATQQHPPPAIYLLLGLLALVSAFLSGFGMAKAQQQSRVHMIGFAGIMAVAIYLIVDLEYPRIGLVRVDTFDQALIDLRESMN